MAESATKSGFNAFGQTLTEGVRHLTASAGSSERRALLARLIPWACNSCQDLRPRRNKAEGFAAGTNPVMACARNPSCRGALVPQSCAMRAVISSLHQIGRTAVARDLADVLPSTSIGPVLFAAAAVIAIFGILDIVNYWPR